MDWLSFIVAGVMVYVAIAIFVVGTVYQIYRWLKTPKSPVRLGMFPRPAGTFGRGLKLVKDSLVFPQVLDNDRIMWFFDLDITDSALDFLVKLNPVTAGEFILPPALLEAMYNHNYRASKAGMKVRVNAR